MNDMLIKGEKLFASGKIEESKQYFMDLLPDYPDNPEILNNLGVIHFSLGDHNKAEDLFLEAMSLEDSGMEALANLERLYLSAGRWQKTPVEMKTVVSAMEYFNKARGLSPDDPLILFITGFLLFKKGELDNAQKAFSEAIELKPDFYKALYNSGLLNMAIERYDEAESLLTSCLETNPSYIPAQKSLEECRKLKKPRKILIVMDEGIGNMIMLTPALRAIMKLLPDAEITVLGKYPSLEVLTGSGIKLISEPEKDAVYDIGFYSIWSANITKVYGKELAAQCKNGPFQITRDDPDIHEADYHMRIAKNLGYAESIPEAFCAIEEVNVPWDENEKVVALSDTTLNLGEWQRKRWPYYKELAWKLKEKGFKIALIGGPVEAEGFDPDGWPELYNLLGKYSIPQTAGVLKKCAMFIGNDSGPAHIAAATGLDIYVLFGSTRITKNRPLGPKTRVLKLDFPCIPCQYTDRWSKCQDFRCMNEMTVDQVLSVVFNDQNANLQYETYGKPFGALKLMRKDYSTCRIIEENNIKYVVSDNIKEPLRIHLVGARKANFPWGMENEIMRAIELAGIEVVDTDYRLDTTNFAELFLRDAHLMIVCKGSGIPPELIKQFPGRTILWYQDDVFTTVHGRRDLGYNGHAFDTVYSFDKSAVNEYKKFGIKDVRYLALAMSPAVHRKMFLPKIHDVSFVGNIHPNRKPFFEKLQKRFNVFVTRAFMDEMVRIFNQSKIVLNLGIGPTGIQQRVFEALGCGSCLVTNEIPIKDRLFEDRKHLVYFNPYNIEEVIAYYLEHDNEREEISKAGYLEAHGKHTFTHRVLELIEDHFPNHNEGKKIELKNPVQTLELSSSDSVKSSNKPADNKKKSLRIFAAFYHNNWEDYNLQPGLEKFGEVIRYNWRPLYNQYDPQWHWGKKQQMNLELLELVKKAHKEKPVDIFFGYLSGRLISPGIVRAITMMGIPTLNLALDDKSKFFGNLEPTGFAGPADIASAFSLCWTSTKDAVPKYRQLGAKAVYMPAGANPDFFKPLDVKRDIDISFIGLNYGIRPQIIDFLRSKGIDIQVFGKGWDSGEIPMEKVVETISRSKITLGIGVESDQFNVVALKGRDFEVPMCGGFYLTQYNPELEEFYDIQKEIVCYNSLEDMLLKIQYYLSHPEQAETIRKAALRKSLAEHTWEKRFQKAFDIMGIRKSLF